MNTTSSSHPGRNPSSRNRALVLGGGGGAGNAWEIGVVAGLHDAGLAVTGADLIIGTSAGSTTAAQLTSLPPAELLALTLDAPPRSRPRPTPSRGQLPNTALADHRARTRRLVAISENPADLRRHLGAEALAATADNSEQARWRATVATRLPCQDWPHQRILIVAVDADTGEPVVFDRDSGVDLVDAVAASCNQGFGPYPIGDNRYIDGGYRSVDNADLATGYGRVLVLSPLSGATWSPPEWGMHLAAHVDELRAQGSEVETVFPDSRARDAFGDNMMDPSRRPAAARAGYDQGAALAERLTEFWHS